MLLLAVFFSYMVLLISFMNRSSTWLHVKRDLRLNEARYFCTSESEPLPRARVNSKFSRYETKKKVKQCQDIQTLRGRRIEKKTWTARTERARIENASCLAVGKWGLNLLCTLLSASYRSGRENFKGQTQSEHSVFFSRTVRLKLLWKIIKIHLNKQEVNSICPFRRLHRPSTHSFFR